VPKLYEYFGLIIMFSANEHYLVHVHGKCQGREMCAKADLIGDYILSLQFDDQTEQGVDFKSFLSDSRHPQIRACLDPKMFAEFRIEYGELVWGDYDLCFPVYDLYRNRLSSADCYQRAA
jgi:hypothetical protein